MIYVIINAQGVVQECISVDAIEQLVDIYTEHLILERVGDETVGWTFDGTTFTPPG
ncbi:hypothetical protein LHU53_15790 [Rhodoferax sp. U2-2l]|uniref:hypothetical protein n=1 Tax=Rhodoferax sp. U2-2l TaxID=2884000 RepID=UPI001D09C9A1|nr:hypothetical protein [Rhodoferax sp. U2-2l]MCB8748363.1 hypothetical protein [Rhodoferax sp. U2-2l]